MIVGKWVNKKELGNCKKAKIISETLPQPSQFLNKDGSHKDGSPKTQDVCRVQFEGKGEAVNVGLNAATINGLVDAFGEDSIKWQGHTLAVETEKVRIAGKSEIALYLIPAGYKKTDDDNGYANIVKADTPTPPKGNAADELGDDYQIPGDEDADVNVKDIPF